MKTTKMKNNTRKNVKMRNIRKKTKIRKNIRSLINQRGGGGEISVKKAKTTKSIVINNNTNTVYLNQIYEALIKNKYLQIFSIKVCTITSVCAVNIAKALNTKQSITTLTINGNSNGEPSLYNPIDNKIDELSVIELTKALLTLENITELDFGSNKNIHPNHIGSFLDVFKTYTKLVKFVFTHYSIKKEFLNSLFKIVQNNKNLKELDISFNNINTTNKFDDYYKDATIFLTNFSNVLNNTKLKSLNISHNNFSEDVMVQFANALEINKTLEDLNISNTIKDNKDIKDITALGKALSNNKTLKKLDISQNNIGDVGAISLSNVLNENDTLTDINISYNNISDNGAKDLANALKKNKKLKYININNNNAITYFGIEALANVLITNDTIIEINLLNIKLNTEEEVDKIARIIKDSRPIKPINFMVTYGGLNIDLRIREVQPLPKPNVENNSLPRVFPNEPTKVNLAEGRNTGSHYAVPIEPEQESDYADLFSLPSSTI